MQSTPWWSECRAVDRETETAVEAKQSQISLILLLNKERSVPVRSVAGGDSGNRRWTNWIWRNGFLSRSPVEIAEIAGGQNRSARSAGNLDAGELETIEG
ncbi:hypothetical protein LXL04_000433 [Taraxacum kok-saghyz]